LAQPWARGEALGVPSRKLAGERGEERDVDALLANEQVDALIEEGQGVHMALG